MPPPPAAPAAPTWGRWRRQAELLTVLFISLVTLLSQAPGLKDLLFPELAAISFSVLLNPQGAWARCPWKLILAPTLTASFGILISRTLPFHVLSLLLAVGMGQLVLVALRSSLTPAIPAGVLPLVLNLRSWTYPLGVALGLAGLCVLLRLRQRGWPDLRWLGLRWLGDPIATPASPAPAVPLPPGRGGGHGWVALWIGTLALLGLGAQLSGRHELLAPPLIVVIHGRFTSPQQCSWIGRSSVLPLATGLAASWGLGCSLLLASQPALAAVSSLIGTFALQRSLGLHLPPLLAIGLLPLLLPHNDLVFPVAVLVASLLIATISAVVSQLAQRDPAQASPSVPQ